VVLADIIFLIDFCRLYVGRLLSIEIYAAYIWSKRIYLEIADAAPLHSPEASLMLWRVGGVECQE